MITFCSFWNCMIKSTIWQGLPNTQFSLHFGQTGINLILMIPSTSRHITIRQWIELYRTYWCVFIGATSFLPVYQHQFWICSQIQSYGPISSIKSVQNVALYHRFHSPRVQVRAVWFRGSVLVLHVKYFNFFFMVCFR